MTGVLKTIIFLIIVYYLWKLMLRLFFPIVAKKAFEKAQQTMEDRMRQAYDAQQRNTGFEGDVTIQKGAGKQRKSISEDEGEYVDFVEVKDR